MDDNSILDRPALDVDRAVSAIAAEFRAGLACIERIDRPAVTVFGSARVGEDHPAYRSARAVGQAFAERGWAVVTGGGGGVSRLASAAATASSLAVGSAAGFVSRPDFSGAGETDRAADLAAAGFAVFCESRSANASAGPSAADEAPALLRDDAVDGADGGEKEETCMHGVTFRVGWPRRSVVRGKLAGGKGIRWRKWRRLS